MVQQIIIKEQQEQLPLAGYEKIHSLIFGEHLQVNFKTC
jgi:hypothetical protein